MTRKDYELLARVIRNAVVNNDILRGDAARLVDRFIVELSLDNSRFDPTVFRIACGVRDK